MEALQVPMLFWVKEWGNMKAELYCQRILPKIMDFFEIQSQFCLAFFEIHAQQYPNSQCRSSEGVSRKSWD